MPDSEPAVAQGGGAGIGVVIPCLNEVAGIAEAVARIVIEPWVVRLVDVNGGSANGTRELLQSMDAGQTMASSDDAPARRDVSRRRRLPRPTPNGRPRVCPPRASPRSTRETTRRGAALRPTFPSQVCAFVCDDEYLHVALRPRSSAQHPGPTLRSYPLGSWIMGLYSVHVPLPPIRREELA